jgi:hypothetical protein
MLPPSRPFFKSITCEIGIVSQRAEKDNSFGPTQYIWIQKPLVLNFIWTDGSTQLQQLRIFGQVVFGSKSKNP